MSTHENEMKSERRNNAERSGTVPQVDSEEFQPLNRVFPAIMADIAVEVKESIGTVPFLRLVRDELSLVIEQGRAALLTPALMGLGQPGFDGVCLTSLSDIVEGTLSMCRMMVTDNRLSELDRIGAGVFASHLEEFQTVFFGLETESVGRSTMSGLLPVLKEFRQICLKLELQLLEKFSQISQEATA